MGMAEEDYMNHSRRRRHRQHSILIGLVLLLLLLSYNIYTSVLEIDDHHQEIQEKNMTEDDEEYVRIRTIDMAFKASAADRLHWFQNRTGDDKNVRILSKFGTIGLAFGAAEEAALPPIFQFRSDPNALRRRRRDMPKPSNNLLNNINHGVELLFSDQLFDFLKNGFQDISSSLDLSFSDDDSVADEKINFLAYLARVLKEKSFFPYESPAGGTQFRDVIARFIKAYHHIPLKTDVRKLRRRRDMPKPSNNLLNINPNVLTKKKKNINPNALRWRRDMPKPSNNLLNNINPNALRDMPKPSNNLLNNINHGVELLFSDQLWWPSIIIIIVCTLLYFLFLFANTIFILGPKCWSAVNPRIQAALLRCRRRCRHRPPAPITEEEI